MQAIITKKNDKCDEYAIPLPYPNDCETIKEAAKRLYGVSDFYEDSIELEVDEKNAFERSIKAYYDSTIYYSIDKINSAIKYYYENIYDNPVRKEIFVKACIAANGKNLFHLADDVLICNIEDLYIMIEAMKYSRSEECENNPEWFANVVDICAGNIGTYEIFPSIEEAVKYILVLNADIEKETDKIFSDENIEYITNGCGVNIKDYKQAFRRIQIIMGINECKHYFLTTEADTVVFIYA